MGETIEIQDFDLFEVEQLAAKYQLRLDSDQRKELMKMIGGHPNLIQKAFFHLKTNKGIRLTEFLRQAPTPQGIYSSHLCDNLQYLQETPELQEAFKQVLDSGEGVELDDPIILAKLKDLGLIKVEEFKAVVRYRLYREYFARCLR